jgi:hypothetical protein
MESALSAAYAHVYRQRWAGKHEQDRIDAQQWIDEFGPLVETGPVIMGIAGGCPFVLGRRGWSLFAARWVGGGE